MDQDQDQGQDLARTGYGAAPGDDALMAKQSVATASDQGITDEASELANLAEGLIGDLQDMVHSELALAKDELRGEAKGVETGAIFVGAAGALGLTGLVFVTQSLVLLLSKRLPRWAAAGLVGGSLTAAAACLGLAGKSKLSFSNLKPDATLQSLKTDVDWLKRQVGAGQE